MASLIFVLTIINITLIIVENAYKESQIKEVQKKIVSYWKRVKSENVYSLVKSCTDFYSTLSDLIYGKSIFTLKFLKRSLLASFLAVMISYTILILFFPSVGSPFVESLSSPFFLKSIFILLIVNIVTDIFSIAETKVFLSYIRNHSIKRIITLLPIDFILSFAIYLVFFLFFRSIGFFKNDFLFMQLDRSKQEAELLDLSKSESYEIAKWEIYHLKEDSIFDVNSNDEKDRAITEFLFQRHSTVLNLKDSMRSTEKRIENIKIKKRTIEARMFNDVAVVQIAIIFVTGISTFFSSLLLYAFVFSSIFIKAIHKRVKTLDKILSWFENQQKPLSKISAIISAFVVLFKLFI